MSKQSPEIIAMRRAEIESRRTDEGYANSLMEAEDNAWLAEVEAEEAARRAPKPEPEVIDDPEAAIAAEPIKPHGETKRATVFNEHVSSDKPEGKPTTFGQIKASKLSSTSMPKPEGIPEAPSKMPKRYGLPGKLQPEYDKMRRISGVDKISKKMFATPTVDPKRKELEDERKRASDMVTLVQQILDQRAQLAIALANVSSTVRLKERREEDLQYMADMSESLSKTIVGNLTDYDLQSYTVIAGLNNLEDDQSLRRAGHHARQRFLELAKVAASMLAATQRKMTDMRTAGQEALRQRDEAYKRISELTGEEFVPAMEPKPPMN